MTLITVEWSITNGIETKIVKHPNGDIWNEGQACSEFLIEKKKQPTSMDIFSNEIIWFNKYSEENIDVYDKWAGGRLPIKNYISHLNYCANELENYS